MKFSIQGPFRSLFSSIKDNIDLLENTHDQIILDNTAMKVTGKREIIVLIITQDRIVTVILKLIEFMAWH